MIDFHIHSQRSADASASMIEVCRAQLELGNTEICFTEHVDFDPTDLSYAYFDSDLYRAQFEHVREAFFGRINPAIGVEVCFQERYTRQCIEFVETSEYDYVLGSVHYVREVMMENHERYFSGKTPREAYEPYFESVLNMVETGIFDAVAHLDLCKRHGSKYFGAFRPQDFREQIERILQAVIERDMTLEINSSGLRQSPGEIYPSRTILEWYHAMGGRHITVGSDSHHVNQVGFGITEAINIVRSIGFDSLDTFRGRRRVKNDIPAVMAEQLSPQSRS
ncbi:MAG: histidinol-phosphatase [Armatimonadota bacterium]